MKRAIIMISTLTSNTHYHSLLAVSQWQSRIDELYNRYRVFATSLIDTSDPEMFYKVHYNGEYSANDEGMHEQYIRHGSSVVDLSVGILDYPWVAADANNDNEVTTEQLMELANKQNSMLVAHRIRVIAQFANSLPQGTRVYYYSNKSGGIVITVSDELNNIKFSHMLTTSEIWTT